MNDARDAEKHHPLGFISSTLCVRCWWVNNTVRPMEHIGFKIKVLDWYLFGYSPATGTHVQSTGPQQKSEIVPFPHRKFQPNNKTFCGKKQKVVHLEDHPS